MQRRVLGLVVLLSFVFQSAAAANPTREEAAQNRPSSTGKRVVWTLIGAGIGFGAGLLFGLRQFDDAINSDRKVWTSALAGAAAGGVAGALLSGRGAANPAIRPAPRMSPAYDDKPVAARSLEPGQSAERTLLARVRSYNAATLDLGNPALAENPRAAELRTPEIRGSSGGLQSANSGVMKADSLRNGMVAGAIVGGLIGLVIVPAQECESSNPECPRMLRIGVGIPAVAGGAAIGALVDKLFEE